MASWVRDGLAGCGAVKGRGELCLPRLEGQDRADCAAYKARAR